MMKVPSSSSSCNNPIDKCRHGDSLKSEWLKFDLVSVSIRTKKKDALWGFNCLNILESLVFFCDKFKDFTEYYTMNFKNFFKRKPSNAGQRLFKDNVSILDYIIDYFGSGIISRIKVSSESEDKIDELKNLFSTACTSLYPACIAEMISSLDECISELNDRYRGTVEHEGADIKQLFKSENTQSFCSSLVVLEEEAIGVKVLKKFVSALDTATQKMNLEVVDQNDYTKIGVISKVQEFCEKYKIEDNFAVKVSLGKLLIHCLSLVIERFFMCKVFNLNFLAVDSNGHNSFFYDFLYKARWSLRKYINGIDFSTGVFYEFLDRIKFEFLGKIKGKELASSDATLFQVSKLTPICDGRHVCIHQMELRKRLNASLNASNYERDEVGVSCNAVLKCLVFFKQYFKEFLETGFVSGPANQIFNLESICKRVKKKIVKTFLGHSFENSSGSEEFDSIFDNFYSLFMEFADQLSESVSQHLASFRKECEENCKFEKDKINSAFRDCDFSDFCSYFEECIGTKMLSLFNGIVTNKANKFTFVEDLDIPEGQCDSYLLQKINLEDSIILFCEKVELDSCEIKNCFWGLFSHILKYIPLRFFGTSILHKGLDIRDRDWSFSVIRREITSSNYLRIPKYCETVFENVFKKFRNDPCAEPSSFPIEWNFSRDLAQISLNVENSKESYHVSSDKRKLPEFECGNEIEAKIPRKDMSECDPANDGADFTHNFNTPNFNISQSRSTLASDSYTYLNL